MPAPPTKYVDTWGDSDEHGEFIKGFEEWNRWVEDALQERIRDIMRYHRLYLGDHVDRRGEHEKWRANVHVPEPMIGVETAVAAVCDIMLRSDPWVQVDGANTSDEDMARRMENLLFYTYRINRWRHKLDGWVRMLKIQGTEIIKGRWARDTFELEMEPTEDDLNRFAESVMKAREASPRIPNPLEEPEGFEQWRFDFNQKYPNLAVGKMPTGGKKEIVRFAGPSFDRVSIEDMRFDPGIDDMARQPMIAQRIVRTKKWLLDRSAASPAAGKPYSLKQVEKHLATGIERFGEMERHLREWMDKDTSAEDDPTYRECVELFEVWQPFAEEGQPKYSVILGETGVINWDPRRFPLVHNSQPYIALRNTYVPGHLLGLSDIQPGEGLFHELDSLRNLRLDAVTLAVLPVLMRLQGMGIPDLQRKVFPGSIIDVVSVDGIRNLMEHFKVPWETFRELDEIKNELNDSRGTYPNVKGQPAAVGRVSATETERRYTAALSRMRQQAIRLEEELTPLNLQALALWYQFGDDRVKFKVAGGNVELNSVGRSELLQAMEMSFVFRGATQALSRDVHVQQLLVFAEKFAALLSPGEGRELARRVYEALGQTGVEKLLSQEMTDLLQSIYELKMQAEKAMVESQLAQASAPQLPGPGSIPMEQAQALMSGGGGGGGGGGEGGGGGAALPAPGGAA